ncbi:MAG: 16S rRNA (guanine(527)-N(7))-methyltransferase RsmG [Oscillospiraceae bacterium]|nr:16S rRNA (guanine(527)-N(7))-methyltransferase RsmG [Oscillospiraceae bacterium]
MLEDILSQGFQELSIPFTDQTLSAFRRYYTILEEKNQQMNLTAITSEDDAARLHFLDCSAVLPYLPTGNCRILDIGSGAGFPGLVLKLLRPELSLTLLDSQQKRVHFLEYVCDALGLSDVTCIAVRAEEAPGEMREQFDAVTSRAVSRLNILAELSMPFAAVGGRFLAMKASAAAEELTEAARALNILGGSEGKLLPCTVPGLDAERYLVSVEKLRPTPAKYPRRYALIKKKPL